MVAGHSGTILNSRFFDESTDSAAKGGCKTGNGSAWYITNE